MSDSYGNWTPAPVPPAPVNPPFFGGPPTYIPYAGPPRQNPPYFANIVCDINGQQFEFYPDALNPNGAWH